MPCDYNEIMLLLKDNDIKSKFIPSNLIQKKLDRVIVIADAAHSIGAEIANKKSVTLCDVSVFSFHSVKNITTGEGGAVVLNLPPPFDNSEVYNYLKHFHLYGQTKSAIDKNKSGNWRYDIVSQGMKANMNDVCASIGLSQIRRYASTLLPERKEIFETYNLGFLNESQFIRPEVQHENKVSSAHLYMLRFVDTTEKERDRIIDLLRESDVGVSVHYIPMAMLTLFKQSGYRIQDYPNTYSLYASELSLPIYNGLSMDQVQYVIEKVIEAFKLVKGH
jgi:dTDP-4-amino-4,6-dideoxygalactose transaminase